MRPPSFTTRRRRGTSILAWSLAHHSSFWTSRESDLLWDLFGDEHVERAFERATTRQNDNWLLEQDVDRNEFLAYLGLGLNALFKSRSGPKRWVEQTPLYTYMADTLAAM